MSPDERRPDSDSDRARRPEPPRALPSAEEVRGLVARCLEGDQDAWDLLFTRYHRLVMSVVGRTFLQYDRRDMADLAGDVCQDVFLSLLEQDYRALRSLRDRARLPGWLTRVARNKAIDALRRPEPKRGAVPLEAVSGEPQYPTAEATETADARAAMAREALESLDAGDRLIIELFYFEQRRYRDIALMLRIPENTVASRLYRIKRRLLQHLDEKERRTGDDT